MAGASKSSHQDGETGKPTPPRNTTDGTAAKSTASEDDAPEGTARDSTAREDDPAAADATNKEVKKNKNSHVYRKI